MDTVRRAAGGDTEVSRQLWQRTVDLGWPGLMHDHARGGAGLGLVDMAIVLEESGRCLMPGPLLSSAAVASLLVAKGDSRGLEEGLLADIVAGHKTVALATVEEAGGWAPELIACQATKEAGGLRISGSKLFVADAASADHFVVTARSSGSELVLVLVARGSEGLCLRELPYIDESRGLGQLDLDGVVAGPGDILASGERAVSLLAEVFDIGRVAIAAESCGAAATVLEMSTEYAKTREQFGRPIGSFQAIQHKLADMYVMLESARSAAYYAAWAIDSDQAEAHQSACLAKAYCSDAFSKIAGEGIQIHGGMGFTWEADPHFYYKRAKASELAFGDPVWNREQAAIALIGGEKA